MSQNILENEYLKGIAGTFLRAPNQLNSILESDSELIDIGNNRILAVTYDAIVEEIIEGLYTDPYQIGWMGVTISISDLAASGATVVGILLDLRIPPELESDIMEKLQNGINDACKHYECYVLGGDTNKNNTLQIGSTGIGLCKNKPVMRKGMNPTDIVYVSGKMGSGSSYAYGKFFENKTFNFLPKARIKEGQLLSKYATCCIDTSDGLIPAICQLMELNDLGFELDIALTETLHKSCLKISGQKDLPGWIFLAGPHGEYELLFTISTDKTEEFEEEAKKIGWSPIKLGHVIDQTEFLCAHDDYQLDVFEIANLYSKYSGLKPKQYLLELLNLHKKMTL